MPGHRWDLGFPFAGPLVLLLASAVFVLEVRRRWRLAVATGEEVVRMARAAAAEAERAEMEAAALAYVAEPTIVSSGGGGEAVGRPALPPHCALCYSPTTKLCARCKAVRYCSGKCQIIHWRQTHEDECHLPRIDDHDNGQDNVSNLKGVQTEGSDLYDNSLEIEGKPHTKTVETFMERPLSESNYSSDHFSEDDGRVVKLFVNTSGIEKATDSFANSSSSSSCSTFSFPLEPSGDASSSENPPLLRYAKACETFSHDLSHDDSRTPVNVPEINPNEVPPSEFDTASLPVNNLSCTSNFEQKASSGKTEYAECRSSGPYGSSFIGSDNCANAWPSEDAGECEGDCIQLDAGSSSQISSKLSGHRIPSEASSANENSSYRTATSEGTVRSDFRDLTSLRFEKSGSVASGTSNDVWLLKSRRLRSLSSFSSVDHESSSGGRRSLSRDASSKIDNDPKVPTKLSESTGFVPNGIYDITSSFKSAYQQIKSTQISRHYSLGSGSHIFQNYKMFFPYDLFIKLYNCDKVEMRPFGLTNCGNSCYANAVLQCLAFTRPLTSYLLQGFHSKTCPKRGWCFTCEFETLLVKAKQGQSPLSPIGILSHIHNIGSNLGHGREEDAHEFLRYAIDTMQSTILTEAGAIAAGTLAEETTLIQLIFGGYLRSKIKCTRCQGKSERNERMMDLTVEIHGDIGTVEEALARFTATEILDGENKYQCSRCKSYERAKKKLTVLEAPNVLTIALKRFQSGKFGKLNKAVQFPVHLDLAPYMSGTEDKSPVYSLYAVIVHQDIMNAAFSGHYVCYLKSTQGQWYKTDDSKVKPVELERVLKKNAYMLFYARCSPRAPSLIRNAISHHLVAKRSKCKEAVISGSGDVNSISMANPDQAEHQRSQDHRPPYWSSDHHPASFRQSDLFHERLLFPKADSSSDTSSLLSCSDEGSCSTDSSTGDSSSTEEYSEYLFGDPCHFNRNSPLGLFSEDSDGLNHSPLISRHPLEAVSTGKALSYEED